MLPHKRKELKNILKLSIQSGSYIVVRDEEIRYGPTHLYFRVYNCIHPIESLYIMVPKDYSLPLSLQAIHSIWHPNILSRVICADGVQLREDEGVSLDVMMEKKGAKEQAIWDCLKDLLSGIDWLLKQELPVKQNYIPLSCKNIFNKTGVYKIGVVDHGEQCIQQRIQYSIVHSLGVVIYELCYNKSPPTVLIFPPYSNAGDFRSEPLRHLLSQMLLPQPISLSNILSHPRITTPPQPVLIPNEQEALLLERLRDMVQRVSQRRDRAVWIVQDAVEWDDIDDHFMECNYRRILLISSLREVQKVIQECLSSSTETYVLVGVDEKEFLHVAEMYRILLRESQNFMSNIEFAFEQMNKKVGNTFLLVLYDTIIEYPQYSVCLQRLMRRPMGLLINIYDMGVKDESDYHSDPDDSRTPMDQLIRSRSLASYLHYLRKVKSQAVEVRDVLTQMCLMGLHIV